MLKDSIESFDEAQGKRRDLLSPAVKEGIRIDCVTIQFEIDTISASNSQRRYCEGARAHPT